MNFLLGYIGALIIVIISYRKEALAFSGAITAFIVGGTIFGFGGWSASIELIVFFLGGSLLSRLNHRHSAQRDWRQVAANGLIPMLCVLLLYFRHDLREEATLLFLGALATMTADTFATEIGMRFGNRTFDILTFTPTMKGLSGGVSVIGIVASVFGAMLIAILSLFQPDTDGGLCGLVFVKVIPVVTIAGICGALIDSIIGATLQAKYRNLNGEIAESDEGNSKLIQGLSFIGNNATNLIASIVGALVAVGISGWL